MISHWISRLCRCTFHLKLVFSHLRFLSMHFSVYICVFKCCISAKLYFFSRTVFQWFHIVLVDFLFAFTKSQSLKFKQNLLFYIGLFSSKFSFDSMFGATFTAQLLINVSASSYKKCMHVSFVIHWIKMEGNETKRNKITNCKVHQFIRDISH